MIRIIIILLLVVTPRIFVLDVQFSDYQIFDVLALDGFGYLHDFGDRRFPLILLHFLKRYDYLKSIEIGHDNSCTALSKKREWQDSYDNNDSIKKKSFGSNHSYVTSSINTITLKNVHESRAC
mmetsp:Transcript_10390/g.25138  ORF Transcript_10390/g.25138 Transcript_10390/m.25138 type:complete len:123 (-) Transcript_10390:248-616(-)